MIVLLFSQLGCTKKIEIEKIVYKENQPDVRVVEYPIDPFFKILRPNSNLKDQNDTIIFNEIDINNDQVMDMRAGVELYHVDTNMHIKVFIYRLSADFELLGYDDDMYGRVLTAFSDTNNYIAPNTDQWKYAFNKEEYLVSTMNVFKCYDNGIPNFCLIKRFSYFVDESRYFFGFRMKNAKSDGQNTYWNYGYFKIQTNGNSLYIKKLVIENRVDKPILLSE